MIQPSTPQEPRRFHANVPYYARYRLGYPQTLVVRVLGFAGLRAGDAVMDLGCGPGTLAIPFAKAGMLVTAIDPEPDMLDEARQAARAAGVGLDLRQGSSFDLPRDLKPFRLVTMGRSFHWMDRAVTLKILDGLVTRDGALAFFTDTHPETSENAWRRCLQEVLRAYNCENKPHRGDGDPGYRSHELLLFDSVFSRLEGLSEFIRHEITADDIVGRAFSQSISSPETLGERAGAFEADLRAGLHALSLDGRFTEIAEIVALVARRPA